jgi:DedD protein
MNSALQNRLVGTIIVVALVVILLPEVLDGEKIESNQEFIDIPSTPSSISIKTAEAFPQDILADEGYQPAPLSDETPEDDPAASSTIATANATPKNNQDAVVVNAAAKPLNDAVEQAEVEIDVKDSGWVVQLGSFRYEKNVEELIAILKQAGYRAYSRPVKTNVGILNKVFVGPELERKRLEQALPHLQELTKLKGKITAFEVSAE